MEEAYIYLVIVILGLFFLYKTGFLSVIITKSEFIFKKIEEAIKEFNYQNKIQSKGLKAYRSYIKKNKEI